MIEIKEMFGVVSQGGNEKFPITGKGILKTFSLYSSLPNYSYKCLIGNKNKYPLDTTFWVLLTDPQKNVDSWIPTKSYSVNDIVYFKGLNAKCYWFFDDKFNSDNDFTQIPANIDEKIPYYFTYEGEYFVRCIANIDGFKIPITQRLEIGYNKVNINKDTNLVYYTNIMDVELYSLYPTDSIYYTLDGSEPTLSSTKYYEPFIINEKNENRNFTLKVKGFARSTFDNKCYLTDNDDIINGSRGNYFVKNIIKPTDLTTSNFNSEYNSFVLEISNFENLNFNFWTNISWSNNVVPKISTTTLIAFYSNNNGKSWIGSLIDKMDYLIQFPFFYGEWEFKFDTLLPIISFSLVPDKDSYIKTGIMFGLVCNKPNKILSLKYKLDNDDDEILIQQDSMLKLYKEVGIGHHTITISIVDTSLFESNKISYDWTIR